MSARKAYAVIGAHYGDEGKGQVTAWICRRLKNLRPGARVLGVLTNGGCQRGHTVNIPVTGFRHVFKHFSSGTPFGADTHFGPEFILNPMQFVKEYGELEAAGMAPEASCGRHNRVQLPADMAVNQYVERRRAADGREHGSVGFGINETVLRYERGMGMSFADMLAAARDDFGAACDRLHAMSIDYARDRVREESGRHGWDGGDGWDAFQKEYEAMLSYGAVRHFLDDLLFMGVHVRVLDRPDLEANGYGFDPETGGYDFFVFENGQGLKLGQQASRSLRHCTPSDTGAFPVIRAMCDLGLDREGALPGGLWPVYVTRTYVTRHGAGPMDAGSAPSPEPPYGEGPDATNAPNDFQGSIRYASLGDVSLFAPMWDDMTRFVDMFGVVGGFRLAVTHCGGRGVSGLPDLFNLIESLGLPLSQKATFAFGQDSPDAEEDPSSKSIFPEPAKEGDNGLSA